MELLKKDRHKLIMEITLEWNGLSGLVKIIFLISIIFFTGYIIGKRAKKK